MVKTLCIVQARLTSSRLPNKILLPLGKSEKSILEHVYERLNKCKLIDKIVFAIPDTSSNDLLALFLEERGLICFRGSEDNVLKRFYFCAQEHQPDLIVRATCDNPLVDWSLAEKLISKINGNSYIGCKDTPLGTSVEVFKMDALRQAYLKATTKPEKEHVTPYIIQNLTSSFIQYNGLKYRLTVDELRDFDVVDCIYTTLYNGQPIPSKKVYDFLKRNPEIAAVNNMVHQKTLKE